jgi:LysM repeat protein
MKNILSSINSTRPAGILTLLVIFVFGMVAVLPGSALAAAESTASGAKITCESWYAVRSNDTLGIIASRFGIEPYQIVNSNDLKSPYTIYMGQKLCIPKAAVHADKLKKLPKKYLNQGAATFTVSWTPGGIIIKPLNFPVKSRLLIKADDLWDQSAQWIKAGVFTTKKGVKEYKIRMPRELKDAHQLSICLKNLNTDLLMCRNTPYK